MSPVLKLLVVGLGGFAGGIARYVLSGVAHRCLGDVFPFGTLAVNVLGCLVIGILMGLVEDRQLFSPETRLLTLVGFLGSFTTFSTFGFETVELVRDGSLGLALGNVALNVVLGIGAVAAGHAAIRVSVG